MIGGQCLTPQPYETKTVDVGFGIKRYVRKMCGSICIKSGRPSPKTHQIPCEEWFQTCGGQLPPLPVGVDLFADENAMNNNVDFQAYNQGSDWHYEGCGPQAIQNVLSYYGVDKKIQDIAPYVSTIHFSDSNIATSPDKVREGLQNMLNAWGDGNFNVQRLSNVDIRSTTRYQLESGSPVIILVHGGSHYQVATGLSGGDYHVVDYVGNDAWAPEYPTLDPGLSDFSLWESAFSGGFQGYQAYTVVTVTRTPK
jgi:hypothetical protein